jgi:hypothetical protein
MKMKDYFGIFGIIYFGIVFLAWCGIGFWMFRVVALRKPGVKMWRDTYGNPFNLIFMNSKLTYAGLKARRNLLICFLLFIFMVLVPLVFGSLLRYLA